MRYLIDTHVLMWSLYESAKVKPHVRQLLSTADHYVSIVSLWEIIIKASLGKYDLPSHFLTELVKSDIAILPLSAEHLETVWHLPHHHGDPFDRMLVAQALTENLTILTSDDKLKRYDAKIILA